MSPQSAHLVARLVAALAQYNGLAEREALIYLADVAGQLPELGPGPADVREGFAAGYLAGIAYMIAGGGEYGGDGCRDSGVGEARGDRGNGAGRRPE